MDLINGMVIKQNQWKIRFKRIVIVLLSALLLAIIIISYIFGPFPININIKPNDMSPMTIWPWKNAIKDYPHYGVTRWQIDSSDNTHLELYAFDFIINKKLHLELYDQDQDDSQPFDDKAYFWPQGVGKITSHLNENGKGEVIAAWNGLFFQYTGSPHSAIGSHVAPVIINGKSYYNVGNHRWSFGVKYVNGKPVFNIAHLPIAKKMGNLFDFGAASASCLVHDGKPLKMQRFPRNNEDPFPKAISNTPEDAGFVRRVDHIRTSRTSMAWSRDNNTFYLLIVKEPDSEAASLLAFKHRIPLQGGWTVADLQNFWVSKDVWNAVNIDGGDVTQLSVLRQDGQYDIIPPRWATRAKRITVPTNCQRSPNGGTMMYFYIREVK